jgi:hypothetical protein
MMALNESRPKLKLWNPRKKDVNLTGDVLRARRINNLCHCVKFIFVIYQPSLISLAWLEIRFFQKIGFLSMWQWTPESCQTKVWTPLDAARPRNRSHLFLSPFQQPPFS